MAPKTNNTPKKTGHKKQQIVNEQWLREILPAHERLTRTVVSLLQNTLDVKGIDFLSVEGRTKTLGGALEKIVRKKYHHPKDQLTDLSAVRVVTYLESQVDEVGKTIRHLFDVDDKNSLDRSKILGSDKIGYRSAHFVCALGAKRGSFPEYDSLGSLQFEIQVRTVLQHGWAELAHDRSFKFGPGLPTHIQRKLNLYAGMLEVVDGAFDTIAKEIDEYAKSLEGKTLDQISSEEITTLTLEKYLLSTVKTHKIALYDFELSGELFDELSHFGIKTTGDLEKITTKENIAAYKTINDPDSGLGFIREVMMLADVQKYFSGPFQWRGIDEASYKRLLKKYDRKKIDSLLAIHGLDIFPDSGPIDTSLSFPTDDMDDEVPF